MSETVRRWKRYPAVKTEAPADCISRGLRLWIYPIRFSQCSGKALSGTLSPPSPSVANQADSADAKQGEG